MVLRVVGVRVWGEDRGDGSFVETREEVDRPPFVEKAEDFDAGAKETSNGTEPLEETRKRKAKRLYNNQY